MNQLWQSYLISTLESKYFAMATKATFNHESDHANKQAKGISAGECH